jgi:hypothetical protein
MVATTAQGWRRGAGAHEAYRVVDDVGRRDGPAERHEVRRPHAQPHPLHRRLRRSAVDGVARRHVVARNRDVHGHLQRRRCEAQPHSRRRPPKRTVALHVTSPRALQDCGQHNGAHERHHRGGEQQRQRRVRVGHVDGARGTAGPPAPARPLRAAPRHRDITRQCTTTPRHHTAMHQTSHHATSHHVAFTTRSADTMRAHHTPAQGCTSETWSPSFSSAQPLERRCASEIQVKCGWT